MKPRSWKLSGAPIDSSYIPASRLASLLPFQCTFLPLVNKADNEDGEEQHHGHEAEETDFLQHDRPRKEERDLEVEQDEQDRDQVVAHVELHARVLEGLEAAFIRREF